MNATSAGLLDAGLTLAATSAAAVSAIVAFMQVVVARRARDATVFLQLADRYNSGDMARSLETLGSWRRRHGEDFVREWERRRGESSDDIRAVSLARRLVTRHFLDIAKLADLRALDRRFIFALTGVSALNLYYEVVIPMNAVMTTKPAPDYEAMNAILRRVRNRFDDGRDIGSF